MRTDSRKLKTGLGVMALLPLLGWAGISQAHDHWRVGDRVEIRPTGIGEWRSGTVTDVVDGQAQVKLDPRRGEREQDLIHWSCRGSKCIRPAKAGASPGLAAGESAATTPPARNPSVQPPVSGPKGGGSIAQVCPAGQLSTQVTGRTLEAQFKRQIMKDYEGTVRPGANTPLSVSTSFQAFQVGKAHTNAPKKGMNGLLEMERKNAPAGTMIYPIKTRHTVCQQWRDRVAVWVYQGRFACYKNSFGGLSCPTDLGHKIIEQR